MKNMKIARIGYGRDGRGVGTTEDGYVYLVNDDVNTGDVLQPVATNWRSQRKFVTTGRVNHSFKETTVRGQMEKQKAEEKHGDLTRVYKAQEVGTAVPQTQKYSTIDVLVDGENGLQIVKRQQQSYRTQLTRGANVSKYLQQSPNANFTSNAKQNLAVYQGYETNKQRKGEQ